MRRVVDIGRRIELIPIDPHFHDITIGLYRQQTVDATTGKDFPVFLVHTLQSDFRCRRENRKRDKGDANTRWNAENS